MENVTIEGFDNEVQFIEVNGEFCLTAEQIAQGLGYSDAECVGNLVRRNLDEIEPFRISHHGDEKMERGRPGYLYTEEGVYIISMLAQTPKAKEFKKKVARVLKALREHKINRIAQELLARSPVWRNILRYKNLGLNHGEIALLMRCDKSTIRAHVRRMEVCGLLAPPKDLPKLQRCVEHLKNRLN